MSLMCGKKMLELIMVFFIIHLSTECVVLAESRTNFDVTKFEKCATNGTVEYSINITKVNHDQYFDLYMKSPIPLDSNVGMDWSIESSLNGRTFLPLFAIHEKDFCKAMNKYMGEFWYDIERAAQLPPGVCPIRAGTYHVHHLLLNFNKLSLQTFPFGILRFTIRGVDKRGNIIVFCIIMEVKNVEN